jgi:hypothetical protein
MVARPRKYQRAWAYSTQDCCLHLQRFALRHHLSTRRILKTLITLKHKPGFKQIPAFCNLQARLVHDLYGLPLKQVVAMKLNKHTHCLPSVHVHEEVLRILPHSRRLENTRKINSTIALPTRSHGEKNLLPWALHPIKQVIRTLHQQKQSSHCGN